MKSSAVVVVLALAAALSLTGCQAAQPDPDAFDSWITEQSEAPSDALVSMVGTAADAAVIAESSDTGIIADFEAPTAVAGAEFSCFGAETMSVEIRILEESGALTVRTDDLVCADGAHPLEIASDGATRVGAEGYSEHGFGAWSLEVHSASETTN